MPSYSAAIVAGIAVACAVAGFIIAVPTLLGFQRWIRSYPPPVVDPERNGEHLRICLDLIDYALMLSPPFHSAEFDWTSHEPMKILQCHVNQFQLAYYQGDGTDPDRPFDSNKLEHLAGGPHEEWDTLPAISSAHRNAAICHAIFRAIYLRIITEGDLEITLLPADMLSTYQRCLTKPPPVHHHHFKYASWTREQRQQIEWLLRQYWRMMTVTWSTELSTRLETLPSPAEPDKPNVMGIWHSKHEPMSKDDPRMPNMLALEALIQDALEPFWSGKRSYNGEGDPEEYERATRVSAQERLREITTTAADLALRAFAASEEREFFWPESNCRGGPMPYEWGGRLQAFGVRRRQWRYRHYTSMSETVESLKGAEQVVEILPEYNDDDYIESQFKGEFAFKLKDELEARRTALEAGTWVEETDSEREKWEKKQRECDALWEYLRIRHNL